MTDIHAVIAELKALEEKATGGTWFPEYFPETDENAVCSPECEDGLTYVVCREMSDEDKSLIAASRNALPQLLAYIERLEAVASAAKAHRESDPERDDTHHAKLGWELGDALDALERDE